LIYKKDVVVGLGEIGLPITKLISKSITTVGFDIDEKLVNLKRLKKYKFVPTDLLHICIPYNKGFENSVIDLVKMFNPKAIVVHSTVKPHSTEKLQKKLTIPVIYSATRGVHQRMIKDLKRYTKFYSVYHRAPKSQWASKTYENRMKKAGIKTKKMSTPLVLEFAKIIVDTSYYGWLITYAQVSNIIAKRNKIDYDEMWTFAEEIQKFLRNRPKMFPGSIGGHCIIPNLDLINNDTIRLIKKLNSTYAKIV